MPFKVKRNSSNKRSIGTAALIRGRRLLTFLSEMRRLFEGGGYSGAALIRVNTVYVEMIFPALQKFVSKQATTAV